jgi:hypothetical protein
VKIQDDGAGSPVASVQYSDKECGQAFAETPSYWRTLDPSAAALLVEIGADDSKSLEATQRKVLDLLSTARLSVDSANHSVRAETSQ